MSTFMLQTHCFRHCHLEIGINIRKMVKKNQNKTQLKLEYLSADVPVPCLQHGRRKARNVPKATNLPGNITNL